MFATFLELEEFILPSSVYLVYKDKCFGYFLLQFCNRRKDPIEWSTYMDFKDEGVKDLEPASYNLGKKSVMLRLVKF